MDTIVNRVAESGIITLDLEQLIPDLPLAFVDLKDNLFHALILREKDFRAFVQEHNWEQYKGKVLGIHCSADAIVPTWAYMLVATALREQAAEIYFADPSTIDLLRTERCLANIAPEDFVDKRVVIKGCGKRDISTNAFVYLTAKLTPVVKSLMYGEPCSTVPVYKKKV